MQTESAVSPGELLARAQAGESVDEIMKTSDNTSTADESAPPSPDESQATTPTDESQDDELNNAPNESEADDSIDYELKVPLHGREPMTLGELKDLAIQQLDGVGTKEQLTEQEKTQRVQTAALQRDLETLAAGWQQQGLLTPEAIQQMQQVNVRQKMLKQRELQTLIPEWSNPQALTADLDTMAEFGASYGINKERFEYMVDWEPQLAFAMRDLAIGYKTVQEKLRKRPPPSNSKGRPKPATAKQRRDENVKRAQSGRIEDKKAAVGAILLDSYKGR